MGASSQGGFQDIELNLQGRQFLSKLAPEILRRGAEYAICIGIPGGGVSVSLRRGVEELSSQISNDLSFKGLCEVLRNHSVSPNAESGTTDRNPVFNVWFRDGVKVWTIDAALEGSGNLPFIRFDRPHDELISTLLTDLCIEGLARRDFESLIGFSNGTLLVAAPKSAILKDSRAALLGMSGALYAGSLESGIDLENVSAASKERLVCIDTIADDAVYALTKLRSRISSPGILNFRGVCCMGLVRKVCSECGRETVIEQRTLDNLPSELRPPQHYRYLVGRGCNACGDSGSKGLLAVQSLAIYDAGLDSLLTSGGNEQELVRYLSSHGTCAMLEDGVRKAYSGKLTFQALFEVAASVPQAYLRVIEEHRSEPQQVIDVDLFSNAEPSSAQPMHGRGAFSGNATDSILDLVTPTKLKKVRSKPLLLVVEDDRDQRNVLEMCFKSAGYDVLEAEDGRRALDLAEQETPDLIVTDLMMPKFDGAQLIARARANPSLKNIPILVLTVISDMEKEYQLLDIGADDYCEKTIQKRVLLKRVENLLKRGSARI